MNAVTKIGDDVEAVDLDATKAKGPAVPSLMDKPAAKKRGRRRYMLMAAVPLALILGGGYVWVTGGRYQETENANLRQARATISAEASGRVTALNIHDNQMVNAGDVLFTVDPAPYKIALAQADAALAGARLNVEQLRAAYGQAVANQQSAQGEVTYLQQDLDRQTALSGKGVSTQSALDTARRNLDKAKDAERAAEQAVVGAQAALGGNVNVATNDHPSVLAAQAARDKAAYDLEQTAVRAPADGMIAQASSFKVGQFVATGSPLFTLVETKDSWVEANFKETQLTHMKPGQTAEVVLDTFPGHPFEATVQSIGAGTGAEFSLLPAQNATGNWVKVTQRIPVRLKVTDPDAQMMLRTGMSATVNVDTGVARGWGSLVGHAYANQ